MKKQLFLLAILFCAYTNSDAQWIDVYNTYGFKVQDGYYNKYKGIIYDWKINGTAYSTYPAATPDHNKIIPNVGADTYSITPATVTDSNIIEVNEEPAIPTYPSLPTTWINIASDGVITCSSNLEFNATTNITGLTVVAGVVKIPSVSSSYYQNGNCSGNSFLTPSPLTFYNNATPDEADANSFILQYLINKLHDFEDVNTANCSTTSPPNNFSFEHRGGVLYLPKTTGDHAICITKLYIWDGVSIIGGCNGNKVAENATTRTILQRVDDYVLDGSSDRMVTCALDINVPTNRVYSYPIYISNVTFDGNNTGRFLTATTQYTGGVKYTSGGSNYHAYESVGGITINAVDAIYQHNHNFVFGATYIGVEANRPNINTPSFYHTGAGGGLTLDYDEPLYPYVTSNRVKDDEWADHRPLKGFIYNCDFINSVGDGYLDMANTDVKLLNCKAINCARGGFLTLGGKNSIKMIGCTASKGSASTPTGSQLTPRIYASQFQAEVDRYFMFSYHKTTNYITDRNFYKNIYMKDCVFSGGVDFTNAQDGSSNWQFSRIYVEHSIFGSLDYPQFDINGINLYMMVDNNGFTDASIFHTANKHGCFIRWPKCLRFDNVKFCQKLFPEYPNANYLSNDMRGLYVTAYYEPTGHQAHSKIGFNNCYFGRNKDQYPSAIHDYRSGLFLEKNEYINDPGTPGHSLYLYFKNTTANSNFETVSVYSDATNGYYSYVARHRGNAPNTLTTNAVRITDTNAIIIPTNVDFHMHEPTGGLGTHCDFLIKSFLLDSMGYEVVKVITTGNKPNDIENQIITGSTIIKVYPNPGKDLINMEYESAITEDINIEIQDVSGKVIKNWTKKCQTGNNIFNLDLNYISAGLYLINVSGQTSGVKHTIKYGRE